MQRKSHDTTSLGVIQTTDSVQAEQVQPPHRSVDSLDHLALVCEVRHSKTKYLLKNSSTDSLLEAALGDLLVGEP